MYCHTMLFIALLFVLQLVSAVTLNDFTPRLNDLSGDCKAIYTSQIDGCAGADFQSGVCSSSCISALQSIGTSVRKACLSQNPDGNNIIGAFLTGQGTSKLCPNAVNANKAGATSQSSSVSIGSSTMVLSDTTLTATGIIVDTSSASPSVVTAISTATINPIDASSSSSTESSTPVFTGITSTITGSSLAFATSTPSSVLVATETTLSSTHSAKHTQSSNTGGGTPFDTSAAAATYGTSITRLTLLSGAVALLFLY